MSQSKITSLKQKVSSKIHRQKTDTTHMTGKNTDLSATRETHNPGYTTATSSTHFDNSQKTTDQVRQNPDHIIRQDSDDLMNAQGSHSNQHSYGTSGTSQYVTPTHTSSTDVNHNGIPDSMERSHFQGQVRDLNGNGIPDQMENRSSSTYNQDLNRNGIPDNLERQGTSYTTTSTYTQGGMTDLNRNGIPDQLETSTHHQTMMTSTSVTTLPDTVEHITKPAIIHEVIREQETRQIQPVVERSREQTDIYEVVQPMRQVEVMPTEVKNITLAPKFIPIVRETEYVESQATIPVQVIRTVHVPITQVTAVTTTRMMTAEESRMYTETQMSSQFAEKTLLTTNGATQVPVATSVTTQSATF